MSYRVRCEGPTGTRSILVPEMPELGQLIVCDNTLEIYEIVNDQNKPYRQVIGWTATYWGTMKRGVPTPRKNRREKRQKARA